MIQTKMNKELKNEANKIIFGFDIKDLGAILLCIVLIIIVMFTFTIFSIGFRVVLSVPIILVLALFLFYKSDEGDNFATFITNVSIFYFKPKDLIFKKRPKDNRR